MHPLPSIVALVALATALAAQTPAPPPAPAPAADARLQELLRELRAQDPAAWAARVAALEQQAKALDADAAKLREQAAGLQQRADAATAEAKARRAEVDKLRTLQQLLTGLPTPTAAPAPAPKPQPAAPPPPAPAKPDATKAPDAKPANAKNDAAAPAALVAWPQVATLFAASCTGCHEPGEQKGGLDLSTFRGALAGGGSGQSIVPGDPDQSRLYRMITGAERPFMPRNADPLTAEQTALVRSWIEQGASETSDAARTFVAERAAKAKAAAVNEPAAEAKGSAPVLPSDVPRLAVRTAARAGPIASLARSPAAPLFALPGVQQIVLLGRDGRPLAALPCREPHLGAVAFAEDGQALVAACGERGKHGLAVVHDVRTGAVLARCGDERDIPLAVAVHHASGRVALGGAGKHTRLFRLGDGAPTTAGKHDDFVLALAFAPDGGWLAAGDRAGNVLVYEPATGRVFQTLTGHQGAVHAVAFDRTGKSLLSAGADGTLRLWDVAAAKERWRQNAHPGQQALACAFGPGDALASCGSDGVIATFTLAGRAGAKSAPVGEWLYAIAFGDSANDVRAGDWRGRLHTFDGTKKATTSITPLAADG